MCVWTYVVRCVCVYVGFQSLDSNIGLLVDAVLQVYRLKDEEIELASSVGGDMNEHVMGIGRPTAIRTLGRSTTHMREDLNDIMILLDAEALLRR